MSKDSTTGRVFGWPVYRTWEFTSSQPIRSIFPLTLLYTLPLTLLKWIWEGLHRGPVPPLVAFYSLRTLMFAISFVLQDGALHELLPVTSDRTRVTLLVASSYVTCTFQTHTFSNSLETILVLWTLVFVRRIRRRPDAVMAPACATLAFLAILGTFNRITFPAFVVVPGLSLLPHLISNPLRLLCMLLTASITIIVAITVDTRFYSGSSPHLRDVLSTTVVTPWNNLRYNMDPANLAQHGLHPFWQHFAVNLPQLLGPAAPLILCSSRTSTPFWTAIVGTALLSCFRHQEARFLLPAVPLLLSSVRIPPRYARQWLGVWLLFNTLAACLFGLYHQAGVVPAQTWIASQPPTITQVFWWKTYSPPRWLLNPIHNTTATTDLMGASGSELLDSISHGAVCDPLSTARTLLVAPASATFLDPYTDLSTDGPVSLREIWRHRRHVGLDDLDFGEDGVWPTLRRVLGRRGLVAWEVRKRC